MKNFFIACLVIVSSLASIAFAQIPSKGYELSFRTEQGKLIATHTTPLSDKRDMYALFSLNSSAYSIGIVLPDKALLLNTAAGVAPAIAAKTDTDLTDKIEPGVLYHAMLAVKDQNGSFQVLLQKPVQIRSGIQTQLHSQWPLTVVAEKTSATLSGQIDTAKHPDYFDFKVRLEISPNNEFPVDPKNPTTPDPVGIRFFEAVDPITGDEGVNGNGAYMFKVTNLTPDNKYYIRQTMTAPSSFSAIETSHFNSSKGFIAPGSGAELIDFGKRSYRLLAPLPGLGVLLDPDLCYEQKAAGKTDVDCDDMFNYFLNYAFRVLIGISAVSLVIRLIIEGYKYAVTDVPFLKTSAKTKLMEASFGLLLALSAYLILNTINPRLVSENISIGKLDLNVETFSEIDTATYQRLTGQKVKPKKDYLVLVEQLSQKNSIDACIVKASISVESNWRPNIIGCDENARASDVPSRKAFINSGIKLDGSKFTERSIDAGVTNACPTKIDTTQPGYGLDWRFSKGGGLMQKTLFPDGYKTSAWYEGVKEGGAYWNKRTTPFPDFASIITPEKNIQLGIDILKNGLNQCGSIEKSYRLYGSGSCTGSGQLLNSSVAQKMGEYQACKNGAPEYKV